MYPKRRIPSYTLQGERIHLWDNTESSKTYQTYIPDQIKIETSRDGPFEEEITYQISKESHMEIDSETIPSPPSAVQRETNIIPVIPVALVDMPRYIAIGNKGHA